MERCSARAWRDAAAKLARPAAVAAPLAVLLGASEQR